MLLPLFPLPNVVLFPGGLLPLHIFEPRYRAMTAHALEGDRRIGMVLLQPGWEPDYEGTPPIFAVGCSGVIVHSARLDDGRYNIVLRGLDRFRVVSEDHSQPYRCAEIQMIPDPPLDEKGLADLVDLRARLAAQLGSSYVEPLPSMPDADFIHTLAQSVHLEAIEKQALLERENVCLRAQALVELMDMKRLEASIPDGPRQTH
jgi:Lon protease-like protein